MLPTSRPNARRWKKMTAVLTLLLLISMTGCSKHLVVVDGTETVTVKKSTIDNLYSDNEQLIKALIECKGKK